MATNSVLRQLHLVVMLMMMTTTLTAGKRFRLRSLGLRARFPPSQLKVVLARLDQLTSLVNDVQQAVEDTQGTVNVIKARVDPPATQPCKVAAQSVGYWESENSYIKLNGHDVLELTSPEDENDAENPASGTYTVLLDKRKCRITEYKYFDTHWKREDGDKLANYLNAVPFDSHVMVLTHGEAFGNMSKKAFDVLCALGVDIADVAEKGMTFAALIVRGSHCRTMYELHQDDLAQLKLQLNGKTEKTSYFTYEKCKTEPCLCPVPEWKTK